jgi:hypothetical protein
LAECGVNRLMWAGEPFYLGPKLLLTRKSL